MAGRLATLGNQSEATEAVRRALEGKTTDWRSRIWEAFLVISLVISFAFLIWLLVSVFIESVPVWQERGLMDFISRPLASNPQKAGISQGLFGSFVIMVVVALLALPAGIAAAIYLEEYAPDNAVSRTLNTVIRNLAGVPAVVYGILGLSFFVLAMAGVTGGRTAISGGLTLAVLVLPITVIVTAEALRAVPASIREAGFGVGATRWEVIRSHVLPYAAPGILTGTVLSLARALGEAAPLILVGAVTNRLGSDPNILNVSSLQERFTSMPSVITSWAGMPQEGFRANTAAAIVVLLVIVLIANIFAVVLRNKYEKKR